MERVGTLSGSFAFTCAAYAVYCPDFRIAQGTIVEFNLVDKAMEISLAYPVWFVGSPILGQNPQTCLVRPHSWKANVQ
jgi:hypothetical protein